MTTKAIRLSDKQELFIEGARWNRQQVAYEKGKNGFCGLIAMPAILAPGYRPPAALRVRIGQRVMVGRKNYTIENPGWLGGDSCRLVEAR